ncbi:Con-6 family protein [Aspergillus ruber CBS 135680]|uniref:Conidiation protein Con-6 n=1 Tax=Aspergillus ruber (strain CBS 135680) TaxID=1388766 RepID=A0A017S113_ASPRC|nr:uncharacterized protein EURHEDRAFT_381931 [Aspergillus ruber CBS 135680]EYE90516.1 hypothetical protein EURHEDRAFT_381931 [Aspergillus ruber CBS 135680]
MKDIGNVARGYKAAIHNRNVSSEGRLHAEEELKRIQSNEAPGNEAGLSDDEERHNRNVARGLKAATHNPNVTDVGKQQARGRLESMGEHPEQPAD